MTQQGANDTTRVAHLTKLAQALAPRDWRAVIVHPRREQPYLRVVDLTLTSRTDTVYCDRAVDGAWEYRWGWEERIGAVDDMAGTVEQLEWTLGRDA